VDDRRGRREIEIKLKLASAAEGRRRLLAAGFRVSGKRQLEQNLVFDTPSRALRRAGLLLRLRRSGRQAWLTYKGPVETGRHKTRREVELPVADPDALEAILTGCGFEPAFRYEKFRTGFSHPQASGGATLLDETPIGIFLELEGSPSWIDAAARRLGFEPGEYITGGYGELYVACCRRLGRRPGHMLFPSRRASRPA